MHIIMIQAEGSVDAGVDLMKGWLAGDLKRYHTIILHDVYYMISNYQGSLPKGRLHTGQHVTASNL